MWPFASDDDASSISSDSSSWNNLNIPPEANGGSWFNKIGQLFYLLGPVAVAYVHWKSKEEQEVPRLEVVESKEKLDQDALLGRFAELKTFQREKEKLMKEEELRSDLTLRQLNKIEQAIKVFLDIRCSYLNPWKTRHHREDIERQLLERAREDKELAQLGLEEGIQQIIMFDYLHCSEGFNSNGQIYRVWMKHWRAMVQNQKNARIASRLEEMLNDLSKMK